MRTAQRDAEGTRVLAGQVSSTGAVVAGRDFTITKTGTGTYTLRWTTPTKATIGVNVNLAAGGFGFVSVVSGTVTGDGFNVATGNSSAAAADIGWIFTATVMPR